MPLDGVLLNSVLTELQDTIIDGKIDKIHQPEKDEIHMTIRAKGENYRLLLSASPNYPRIHFTEQRKQNPDPPPMFCMLLRKHLTSGRIVNIVQPQFERIIELHIESKDELGDVTVKRLIIEIMGRHSNIILVDGNGKILDSIKHITDEISRVREVLPGKQYVVPPSHGKVNPLETDSQMLMQRFNQSQTDKKADRFLSDLFTGVSLQTAGEICFLAIGARDLGIQELSDEEKLKIIEAFKDFFQKVKNKEFQTVVLKDPSGMPRDIFPFPYFQYSSENQEHFASVSQALEYFYLEKDRKDRMHQRSAYLNKVLKQNLERCRKKLAVLQEELLEAENDEKYRLWGELITANIYQIPKGAKEVSLLNYYDPEGSSIIIPLDENKTAAKNAEAYFRKYNKAKKALEMISRQIEENQLEIQYLESLLHSLENCTDELEVNEIRQELIEEGYIKAGEKAKQKDRPSKTSKPHHFISSDGFDMYVGKNNHQNDMLTLKIAGPNDIWLHTKNIPGSHVIIKADGKKVPEKTLLEAGLLAATFSKGKQSSNVPVDYCPRKNVKKSSGAKPGMVIYENYKTMYITPSEEEVKKLKKIY